MKSFDWPNLLHHHPSLSVLTADEVQWLLQETVSREHNYLAGFNQVMNLRDNAQQMTVHREKVEETAKRVNEHLVKIDAANVEQKMQGLQKANEQVAQLRDFMKGLLRYRFTEALQSGGPGEAIEFYRQLRSLHPEDRLLAQALFNEMENAILNPENPTSRRGLGELLVLIGGEARASGETRDELWSQYLRLANGLLATPEAVEVAPDFKRVIAQHKQAGVLLDDDIKRLKDSIAAKDPERAKRFEILLTSR